MFEECQEISEKGSCRFPIRVETIYRLIRDFGDRSGDPGSWSPGYDELEPIETVVHIRIGKTRTITLPEFQWKEMPDLVRMVEKVHAKAARREISDMEAYRLKTLELRRIAHA